MLKKFSNCFAGVATIIQFFCLRIFFNSQTCGNQKGFGHRTDWKMKESYYLESFIPSNTNINPQPAGEGTNWPIENKKDKLGLSYAKLKLAE